MHASAEHINTRLRQDVSEATPYGTAGSVRSGRLFCGVYGGSFFHPFGTWPGKPLGELSSHLLMVRRRVRMKHAMDGSSRDAVRLGDLAHGPPAAALQQDRLAVEFERPAPDLPAFQARPLANLP